MTDTTKPDLSRVNAELAYERRQTAHLQTVIDRLNAENRALLDAKEAAERECLEQARLNGMGGERELALMASLTEARASAAASWEAGRDAAAEYAIGAQDRVASTLTNPDPSATEALRRVKEAAWDEGYAAGCKLPIDHQSNPYAAKDAAHG